VIKQFGPANFAIIGPICARALNFLIPPDSNPRGHPDWPVMGTIRPEREAWHFYAERALWPSWTAGWVADL